MTQYSRREILASTLAASVAGGLSALTTRKRNKIHAAEENASPMSSEQPNILVVLTDDQHYQAMGCAGNPIIQTPHIDALAAGGTLFSNAFVTTPICCTSRASIFTGTYALSNGIHEFYADLPPDLLDISYPVMLRNHGYFTGFVGKYGVGTNYPVHEYDSFFGLPGNGRYVQEIEGETRHMTDMLADEAVRFLETCPQDKPFCLSLSTRAPHAEDYDPRPYPPPPAFEHLYEDDYIPPPELAKDEYYEALPSFLKNSEGRKRWDNNFPTPEKYQESVRDYYRMITGIDHAIGRMREVLEKRGLADNTVIIFLSDNGKFLGHRGLSDKWYAYEDSIRVPLIIYDPRTAKSLQGKQVDAMALNIDIAPTLLELANIPIPEIMQGKSLVPFLQGASPDWREHWMFEHRFEHPGIPKSEGVRTTRWKYFRWLEVEENLEELYDLETDPLEINNLAGDMHYADQLQDMRDLLSHYLDTLPVRQPPARPGI